MGTKSSCVVVLCALLVPVAVSVQRDIPAPSKDCRFITATDLFDPKAPRFEAYPAADRGHITNPRLDLTSSPIAKRYRTVLRMETAKGPNYDGHYRVAFWGCGASCAMFALVNLKTGRVITAREFTTVLGTHLDADEFLPNTESNGWGFRYKSESALIVVVGAPDEDESRAGAYYFVLQAERLRLIHTTRVTKNCEDAKPKP